MLTRFTTLAIGDSPVYAARTIYTMLAVLAQAPADRAIECTIVTDHPERFRWVADTIRILPVDQATVTAWKGPHSYFFRCEIEVLRLLATLGPAHLAYLDSDIIVRQDLTPFLAGLDRGEVFMHTFERDIRRLKRHGDKKLWQQIRGKSAAGIAVDANGTMWNAGVMAVPWDQRSLIDQVMAFNDGMMAQGATHWLIEQYSYSRIFHGTGRLHAAEPWMDHWWANKPGYDPAIAEFLLEARMQEWPAPRISAEIRQRPIRLPLMVRKRWYHRLLRAEPRYRP